MASVAVCVPLSAVEAELARRYPYKLPSTIKAAAPHVLAEAAKAWDCYARGAAGALFDVLAFFDACGLAPSPLVREARDALLANALRGQGETRGRGARAPLAAHDAALRRRLRFHAVARVLFEARRYEEEREIARSEGFGPAWWAEHENWPGVSEEVKRACELAKAELGETMPAWRAIYDDFRALDREVMNKATWPGPFYLPTEETCVRLGLSAGLELIRGEWAFSDGPCWAVA